MTKLFCYIQHLLTRVMPYNVLTCECLCGLVSYTRLLQYVVGASVKREIKCTFSEDIPFFDTSDFVPTDKWIWGSCH